jgi:hypothetical protein
MAEIVPANPTPDQIAAGISGISPIVFSLQFFFFTELGITGTSVPAGQLAVGATGGFDLLSGTRFFTPSFEGTNFSAAPEGPSASFMTMIAPGFVAGGSASLTDVAVKAGVGFVDDKLPVSPDVQAGVGVQTNFFNLVPQFIQNLFNAGVTNAFDNTRNQLLGGTNPQDVPTTVQNLANPADPFGFCFAAGTAILMADGSERPIETVEPGDWVVAFDGDRTEARQVTRLFRNVTTEWLILRGNEVGRLSNGGLTVTPGHRFLAADGKFRDTRRRRAHRPCRWLDYRYRGRARRPCEGDGASL